MPIFQSLCLLSIISSVTTSAVAARKPPMTNPEHATRLKAGTKAMEAFDPELSGQLAGGIAHDLANIIHAVEAAAGLIVTRSEDEGVRRLARIVSNAASRGLVLSQQMLDLTRPGAYYQQGAAVLMPAAAIKTHLVSFLLAAVGPKFRLRFEERRGGVPLYIRGDASGLERAITNLVMNARDAMPKGGTITVNVEGFLIDEVTAHTVREVLTPGRYARISVVDTGTGMSPEVLAKVGIPYFTTKVRGSGAGLGLASVKQYAKRYGGGMQIDSAEGGGTTVSLFLPETEVPGSAPARAGCATV